MEKKLENPVWFALQETHQQFSVSYNGVHFYDPLICPFGAFEHVRYTENAINKYALLTDAFFLVSEGKTPLYNSEFVTLVKKMEGCQMVLEHLKEIDITEDIVLLTEDHVTEIYELIWLVMPGYYRLRTFDMGNYYGIFKNNKLVSISGQRMQTNDFIEVSAVVTHPEHTKKGYAKQLTFHNTKEILALKKTPILHTNKGNPAIQLYETLGYKHTRDMNWWLFHRN